jgi:hypothetical protein
MQHKRPHDALAGIADVSDTSTLHKRAYPRNRGSNAWRVDTRVKWSSATAPQRRQVPIPAPACSSTSAAGRLLQAGRLQLGRLAASLARESAGPFDSMPWSCAGLGMALVCMPPPPPWASLSAPSQPSIARSPLPRGAQREPACFSASAHIADTETVQVSTNRFPYTTGKMP